MDASYFVFYPDICFFCAMTCHTPATVREKSSLLMVLSVNVLRIRLKNLQKKSYKSLERKSKGSTFASAFDKESHPEGVRAKLEKDENTNE